MQFILLTSIALTCNVNGTHNMNLNFLNYEGAKEVREVCEARGPGTYPDMVLDIYEEQTPDPRATFRYFLNGELNVERGWEWSREVHKCPNGDPAGSAQEEAKQSDPDGGGDSSNNSGDDDNNDNPGGGDDDNNGNNGGGPKCNNGIGNGGDGCSPGNSGGTPNGGQDD